MIAVIMAGGKGTRISGLFPDIPKPLIPIDNIPLLERTIFTLKREGIKEFILTVGFKAESIMSYFGDGSGISPVTGRHFDVKIDYIVEEKPMGNAWSLFIAKDKLKDDFLLVNGDLLFDIDLEKFIDFHQSHPSLATILTHPNNHPYDSSLVIADKNGVVKQWTKSLPQYYKNRVNAGIHALSPKILETEIKRDLDNDILKPLAGTGQLYCYDSSEYVKDAGTPERYEQACDDIRSGLVRAKNLRNKQKAVFLDRDGVINKHVGFLTDPDQFVLLDNVAESIKQINKSGYLAIVVTNQPIIARGDATVEELELIHNKMETLLGQKGAYLDAIYYCPHHPDNGFPGEIKELKINCECRKPKPGMLLKAAKDFNIDLNKSYMIGDSQRDIEAGKAAGCTSVLIEEGKLPEFCL